MYGINVALELLSNNSTKKLKSSMNIQVRILESPPKMFISRDNLFEETVPIN
jgi:hypothetical protein